MAPEQRREFLKKLAKAAAYAAPVVVSLAAPVHLVGQGSSSMHDQHHGAEFVGPGAAPDPGTGEGTSTSTTPSGNEPPWQSNPPPGRGR